MIPVYLPFLFNRFQFFLSTWLCKAASMKGMMPAMPVLSEFGFKLFLLEIRRYLFANCKWAASVSIWTMFNKMKHFLEHYAATLTHQNNASFGCGELDQDPLISVGSPHAEPVSLFQSKGQQPSCGLIHLRIWQGQKHAVAVVDTTPMLIWPDV